MNTILGGQMLRLKAQAQSSLNKKPPKGSSKSQFYKSWLKV